MSSSFGILEGLGSGLVCNSILVDGPGLQRVRYFSGFEPACVKGLRAKIYEFDI